MLPVLRFAGFDAREHGTDFLALIMARAQPLP